MYYNIVTKNVKKKEHSGIDDKREKTKGKNNCRGEDELNKGADIDINNHKNRCGNKQIYEIVSKFKSSDEIAS